MILDKNAHQWSKFLDVTRIIVAAEKNTAEQLKVNRQEVVSCWSVSNSSRKNREIRNC